MLFEREHQQLGQFLGHIHRALDDAVLCQRLALDEHAISPTPAPTLIKPVLISTLQDAMTMIARCGSVWGQQLFLCADVRTWACQWPNRDCAPGVADSCLERPVLLTFSSFLFTVFGPRSERLWAAAVAVSTPSIVLCIRDKCSSCLPAQWCESPSPRVR